MHTIIDEIITQADSYTKDNNGQTFSIGESAPNFVDIANQFDFQSTTCHEDNEVFHAEKRIDDYHLIIRIYSYDRDRVGQINPDSYQNYLLVYKNEKLVKKIIYTYYQ